MEMNNQPFIIERTYNAPAAVVWQAITLKEQMKEWYFDLEVFEPVEGFVFQFTGENEGKTYIHNCRITEVIAGKKLSYSWAYEGYHGSSLVSFEIFPEGEKTRLRLTHAGLETFPRDNTDFAKENFIAGWTDIIGQHLKAFVEKR